MKHLLQVAIVLMSCVLFAVDASTIREKRSPTFGKKGGGGQSYGGSSGGYGKFFDLNTPKICLT